MIAVYMSSNQFRVEEDRTGEFKTGRRIKANCDVDGYIYSTILSSSYSFPYTIVTIVENVLTSNLIDVLYGIVNIGETGAFPDHLHDGTEGQGGSIAYIPINEFTTYSGVIQTQITTYSDTLQTQINNKPDTFLELIDTPSSYDSGNYAMSTSSGIVWATAGSSNVQTFLDLTDTPTTYSGTKGLFAQSTSSGIVWTNIGISWFDNFSSLPIGNSYVLDNASGDVYFNTNGGNYGSIVFTIDHLKIEENLYNFSVRINLSDSIGTSSEDVSNIFNVLGENNKKIKVLDSNLSECYVEIVYWDMIENNAILFVNLPFISSTEDTIFTLTYSSLWEDNIVYIGDQGGISAQSVYDFNDKIMLHMNQTPINSTASILDSTLNNTHATPYNFVDEDLVNADIGKALNFDGTDNYLLSNSSIIGSYSEATISLRCYNIQGKGTTYQIATLFGRSASSDSNDILLGFDSTNKLYLFIEEVGGTNWASPLAYQNQWIQIDMVYKSSTSVSIYVNGELLITRTITQVWNTGNLPIGDAQYSYNEFFNGYISEFRVSNTDRGAAWIKANSYSMGDGLYSASYVYSTVSNNFLGTLKPAFKDLIDTPSTYSGTAGKFAQSTGSGIVWAAVSESGSSNVQSFLDLTDTPNEYSIGKFAQSTASGIVWTTASGSGTQTFIELNDTPSSYDGQEGKFIKVVGNTLEFATVSGLGGTYDSSWLFELDENGGLMPSTGSGILDVQSFLDLTDTPNTYSDGLYAKSTASGIVWATVSGGGGTGTSYGELELTYSPNIVLDFTTYNLQSVILTGNTNFTFTNMTNGKPCVLNVIQDAQGSRSATFQSDIRWPQGVIPTTSSGSGLYDIFTFIQSRGTICGSCSAAFQLGS